MFYLLSIYTHMYIKFVFHDCLRNLAFWIGLQIDLSSTTQMFWSDCENLGIYTDWHPSDPKKPNTQKCIYKLKATQNWKTSQCNQGYYFICEINYGKSYHKES